MSKVLSLGNYLHCVLYCVISRVNPPKHSSGTRSLLQALTLGMSIFGSLINMVRISDCSRSSKFSLVVRKMAKGVKLRTLRMFVTCVCAHIFLSVYLGIRMGEGPSDQGKKSTYLNQVDSVRSSLNVRWNASRPLPHNLTRLSKVSSLAKRYWSQDVAHSLRSTSSSSK